ncbi:hypothetical protein ABH999_005517 [Bradyrhizobium yuanmingense]|uniref:hypothetical protein n=1 Tax=Bradyrhizobium yuanmingense TaxID=108015 RepID=UPI003514F0CB
MSGSHTALPVVRVYISVFKRNSKACYGICIKWFGHDVFASGWFGDQRVNAQMIALDCALSAIELSGVDVQVHAIFRSEYILQRLSMATTRKIAEQHGITSRPMVEDKERWQDVAIRAQEAGIKINMALSKEDQAELNAIHRKVEDRFYTDREFRYSLSPLEPTIELPDVQSGSGQ